jgi:methylmalonyl-CoA/ethylmalonyl-CoA epimerase
MRKIEHIGIAVKSMDEAIPVYEKLLNTKCYKIEGVASEGVKTAFFKVGDAKIELLEATNQESPIAKYLAKKGAGMHHIAYDVADIFVEIERLKEEGFQLIQASPKEGADNKLIAFLHPKSTAGTLVELCQERAD